MFRLGVLAVQNLNKAGGLFGIIKTERVEIESVPGGTRNGLATISGTRPEDTSDRQVVGWFHTHPNKNSEGYRTGPSIGDLRFTHVEARVPGIIETHDGRITIPYP